MAQGSQTEADFVTAPLFLGGGVGNLLASYGPREFDARDATLEASGDRAGRSLISPDER